MHHKGIRHQRAQHLELLLPMPRQPVEQRIHLAFLHWEILEKAQQFAGFVERQADTVYQMRDLTDDLQTVLAPAEHARNPAIAAIVAAINLVSDQHGDAILQPPDHPDVGQATLIL